MLSSKHATFTRLPLAPALGLACALALVACKPGASEAPSEDPAPTADLNEDRGPETIEFDAAFSGAPLRSAELSAEARLEVFAEGEGPTAKPGKRVSLHFDGYDAASGERVMGTREWPAKMVLGSAPRDPVEVIMQEAVTGLRAGARARVAIPAVLVNAGRSEQQGELGDLWVTLTVTEVDEPQGARDLSAFAGEPVHSARRDGGLEIYDYDAGEGPVAVDGDRVEFHYLITSLEGEQLLDTHEDAAVEMTVGSNSGVLGLSRGLRGVAEGSLRKLVIPAELGFDEHAPEPFPKQQAMMVYVEVLAVHPGEDR